MIDQYCVCTCPKCGSLAARKERKLSQFALAEALEITPMNSQMISQYECGYATPSQYTAARIDVVLGINITALCPKQENGKSKYYHRSERGSYKRRF